MALVILFFAAAAAAAHPVPHPYKFVQNLRTGGLIPGDTQRPIAVPRNIGAGELSRHPDTIERSFKKKTVRRDFDNNKNNKYDIAGHYQVTVKKDWL